MGCVSVAAAMLCLSALRCTIGCSCHKTSMQRKVHAPGRSTIDGGAAPGRGPQHTRAATACVPIYIANTSYSYF